MQYTIYRCDKCLVERDSTKLIGPPDGWAEVHIWGKSKDKQFETIKNAIFCPKCVKEIFGKVKFNKA